MKSAVSRATKQRKAIVQAVRSLASHPTAEQVYETVRGEIPRVSLGTVYRNLQRLVSDGELSIASVGDRVARFDSTTVPHDHFVCETCGSISDVLRERDAAVDFRSLEEAGYRIRSHALSISGLCPNCRGDA